MKMVILFFIKKNFMILLGQYKYWILYKNNQNKIITDSFSFVLGEGQTKSIDYAHDVNLSHKWYDRPDCLNILLFVLVIFVTSLWLTNLFTSIFKKGGILGGLL